jgi:hypothetical protein
MDVDCPTAFASKPAPTGFAFSLQFHRHKHETFVMKLNDLRPNVAYLAGCRTVSVFAKNRYQTQPFT